MMTGLQQTKAYLPAGLLALFLMVSIGETEAQDLSDDIFSPLVSYDQVVFYTAEWEGERDQYGRPLVSDDIVERMKYVGLEEAWGTLRSEGYNNKFDGGWDVLRPGQIMTGRALTLTYVPESPDLQRRMVEETVRDNPDLPRNFSQWPVYILEQGDVYVADAMGKIKDGPVVGDNFAQQIYTSSGNGPVFDGASRDLDGQSQIEGFNTWVRGWHPSAIQEMTLASINGITRIGDAVVLPGDVVHASDTGIIFIPPHLAEHVLLNSEVTRLMDTFRRSQINRGEWTLASSYNVQWSDEMNADFYDWIGENRDDLHVDLGVGEETLDRMIDTRARNWRQWLSE